MAGPGRFWIVALCGVAHACAAARPGEDLQDAPGTVPETLIIQGGILVHPDAPPEEADLVLEGDGHGLILAAVTGERSPPAADTVDASGLYVHSANPFDRSVTRVGRPALFVLRRGPSPGDPAVGLVDPGGWRPVHRNHPAGPVDGRVGCYSMEWEAWRGTPRPRWMPDGLRLHWQYLWHLGRETVLVATDLEGDVGASANFHGWRSLPGDSLWVGFSHGLGSSTTLSLARTEEGYVGETLVRGDVRPGPEARARTLLTRIDCPERRYGRRGPIGRPLRRVPST